MNGSQFPVTGHELVSVLRHPSVVAFLCVLAIVLALPSGGAMLGDLPLWSRLVLNLASVLIFIALFPAFYFDAAQRAVREGRDGVQHLYLIVPAAFLTSLATEALAIIITGESALSRTMLLTKSAAYIVFWELLIFLIARYFAPALVSNALVKLARHEEPKDNSASLAFGMLRIGAGELRRIETDGRSLRLYLDERFEKVNLRLRDLLAQLAPYGILVHRCHWVSYAQLGPLEQVGRSYRMKTKSGEFLPVARERRQAVMLALAKGHRG